MACLSFEIEAPRIWRGASRGRWPVARGVKRALPRHGHARKDSVKRLFRRVEAAAATDRRDPPDQAFHQTAGRNGREFRPATIGSRSKAWRSRATIVRPVGRRRPVSLGEGAATVPRQDLQTNAFFIDKYPVTNRQFKAFLDATGYRPTDDHNFLKDWNERRDPTGVGKEAGHVGLDRGRPGLCGLGRQAIAARMGVAYAAQGCDGRAVSVGQQPQRRRAAEARKRPRVAGPTDVDAFPKGASPVRRDGHDRNSGSGPTSTATSTRGRPLFAAAATTARPAHAGISRGTTSSANTASTC